MKTVIFDLDGTLIDTSEPIWRTINHVRARLGLPPLEKQETLDAVNSPNAPAAQFFYAAESFSKEHAEIFGAYYEAHCLENIRTYDGVADLLKALRQDGFLLAVATNATTHFAQKILRAQDLSGFFTLIAGADKAARPKPDPAILHYCLQELGASANECVFIGDSHKDRLAAQAINMRYQMVGWGFCQVAGAKDPRELLGLIKEK